MARRILDLFEHSGDEHVGQTLVRLARLAEASHRFEAAIPPKSLTMEIPNPVEGLDPWPVTHTEVGR